jgi:hypothetical protein
MTIIDPFPAVPLDELPPVHELTKDYWFQSRFRSEVERSPIAKQLLREGFRLDGLVTQALLSFHRDGQLSAKVRALGMEHQRKQLAAELATLGAVERNVADVEVAKQAAQLRRETKRRLDAADELSGTKHFGVTWQALWLVILKKQIAARTGWERRKVVKAVEALVTIALRSANVQVWFGRRERLRELIASAIADFENDPRHAHQLRQLDSIPQRHRELFPYL